MRKLTMPCWLYTFLPCTNHLSISPEFLIDALLTFFGAERSLESSKNTALKVHYLSTASLPPLQKTSEITTTKWEHGTRWDKQLGSTAEHKWPEERGSSRQLRHRTAWTNHLLVKSLCRCPPCQYRQRQCHPAPCSPCWGSSQWASYCRQACGPPVWWPWSPPSFAGGRSCWDFCDAAKKNGLWIHFMSKYGLFCKLTNGWVVCGLFHRNLRFLLWNNQIWTEGLF